MVEIDGRRTIWSVVFLDGKHVVSGGQEQKIRRWRVEDGAEVEPPMNTRDDVNNIAASRDGKWIVAGTRESVEVWSAESGKKVSEFRGHSDWVYAVDVSPDGTRVASGARDKTANIWSLSTGQRLLGPWRFHSIVSDVKFSPDGRLLATASERNDAQDSLRIYDSQNGHLLLDVPIKTTYSFNQSVAWSSNSERLFALSRDRKIYCLDAFTGKTLSRWPIHGNEAKCIALSSDSAVIAASSDSSVSFWNVTTRKQIGSVIEHIGNIECMAISADHEIVIGGGNKITLGSLCNILPSSYCDTVSTFESKS